MQPPPGAWGPSAYQPPPYYPYAPPVAYAPYPAGPYPYYPFPVPYVAPPRPRGPPRKGLLQAGAGGLFMLAGSSIAAGVLELMFGFTSFYGYPWWIPVVGVLMLSSLVLSSVGYFGKYHNYGSEMGAGTGIFALIAGPMFLALTAGGIESYDFGRLGITSYYSIRPELFWTGYILLGVAFILMGTSHILSRNHLTIPGLCVAAGVLMIIGGSLIITLVLSFAGYFVLGAGGILGGINLLKAPVYGNQPGETGAPGLPPAYGGSPPPRMAP